MYIYRLLIQADDEGSWETVLNKKAKRAKKTSRKAAEAIQRVQQNSEVDEARAAKAALQLRQPNTDMHLDFTPMRCMPDFNDYKLTSSNKMFNRWLSNRPEPVKTTPSCPERKTALVQTRTYSENVRFHLSFYARHSLLF